MEKSSPVSVKKDLFIERIIDAPVGLVWKAWTDPERIVCWWGPRTWTTPTAEVDLRVGGKNRYCMRSPEGKDTWGGGVYREIVPLERIVTTDTFQDATGKVVPASYYGMSGDFPLELLVTATFEDLGDKTKITLRHQGLPEGNDRDMARQGWSESLDKLDEFLR